MYFTSGLTKAIWLIQFKLRLCVTNVTYSSNDTSTFTLYLIVNDALFLSCVS